MGSGNTATLKKELEEVKKLIIKPELPVNCTKSESKEDKPGVTGNIFAIIVSFILIIILIRTKFKYDDEVYGYDKNGLYYKTVISSLSKTQKAFIYAGIGLLLAAIGGSIYYIAVESPKVIAKKNKDSWPIDDSDIENCNLFFNYIYDDAPITVIENSNKMRIVFPANKAIRKIKVKLSSLESTAVLTVRENDKSLIIDNSFSEIIGGYQCVYDVMFTSDKYTIDLVTNDPESVVTYMASDIPDNLVTYVNTYNIVGRQCEHTTIVVAENDKGELEIKKKDTYC